MEDTSTVAGKLEPLVLNKSTMNNNKGQKWTASQESQQMECTLSYQDKFQPKKRKPSSEASAHDLTNSFETTAAGASRDISMLLTKFAQVLRERAAADTSKMKELEILLTEARNLESYLKEKKSHLKQTLAQISDKLQG
ncbi:uncharacterized protein LOC101167311 [Oryzias latipes]|uniref:Uncharacterized protein n=2 Tax=Oryzias latipes TaxID=8090 RepID=A0A3B3ILV3_ORYLA|nr:uncharacterized protein LOC101167311 [Oryzias latipes]